MWKIIGHQRELAYLNRNLEDGSLVHAYLFSGPAGVGKSTLAAALSRAVNCQGNDAPCGECSQCIRILAGLHPDVQVINLSNTTGSGETRDRTEIGIDQVRDLQRWTSLPPYEGKYRIFIVDEAHQLSIEAANCLLKVLEEPPDRTLFILVSAEPERLPDTIISRCHHIRLHSVGSAPIEKALVESGIEPELSHLLAVLCHGSPGLAFKAARNLEWQAVRKQKMDQLIAVMGEGYSARLDFAGKAAGSTTQRRPEMVDFLEQWSGLWRDLLMIKQGAASAITNIDYNRELAALSSGLMAEEIKDYIQRIQKSLKYVRRNVNPQLLLEVLMLEMPAAGRPFATATCQENK